MVGLPSIITGIIVGLIRAVLVDEDKVFDVVPADFTINALISVMWDTVNRYYFVNMYIIINCNYN